MESKQAFEGVELAFVNLELFWLQMKLSKEMAFDLVVLKKRAFERGCHLCFKE